VISLHGLGSLYGAPRPSVTSRVTSTDPVHSLWWDMRDIPSGADTPSRVRARPHRSPGALFDNDERD
jgi:hypothetical protein